MLLPCHGATWSFWKGTLELEAAPVVPVPHGRAHEVSWAVP